MYYRVKQMVNQKVYMSTYYVTLPKLENQQKKLNPML